MRDERLEVSVTFVPAKGYVASAPELRQPVVALSLGGLRRKIEGLMLPDEVEVRLDALIWRCEALRGRVPPQGPFGRNRRRQGRWAGDAGLPGCPTPAPPRKRAVPAFHKPLESLAAPGGRPLTVNQLTKERMAASPETNPRAGELS
jgi:hypothetical protein